VSLYSPEKRTALVFCGSGAHGAYHAGVLRALQEAGVKIDIVAGHGIGAASAALAAIDGGARLWEADGLWRAPGTDRFYQWRASIRAAGWLTLTLIGVLLVPLAFVAAGLAVYPLGFLLGMFGGSTGASLLRWYSEFLGAAFSGTNLPTVVPRLGVTILAALILTLAGSVASSRWRAPVVRRARGAWWWRPIAAPLDAGRVQEMVARTIWQLIRGASSEPLPPPTQFSRRYADVVTENLGQPGFRELMLITTDLDTRRDVIAAFLREPYRHDFMAPRPGRERRAEVLDLAGTGRDQVFDVLAGALTLPSACEPHLMTYASDSYWRGETHRVCDRPGSLARLLEELSAAGVSQVIVVSAVASAATPHRLVSPRLDLRHRLGEWLEASEAAALRDAVEGARLRFDVSYVTSPVHNPVGPFDFAGAYDESSDRLHTVMELMARGYEDAYHQFIELVVGASGEQLVGR
jgi:hypothetical protein